MNLDKEFMSKCMDVYQMLEDEESQAIWLNRFNWLITGDYQYIQNIVTTYLPELEPIDAKTILDLRNLLPKDRRIVLYGAGKIAAENINFWRHDSRFIGFCSQTKSKQEHGYLGYPVMSPEELLSQKEYSVVINTTSSEDEIVHILRDGGYPADKIYRIGDYFLPGNTTIVPCPHITGMQAIAGQYFEPDFMTYADDGEVFVDAGCFDLGTSLELKKQCGRVKRVYAFEPNERDYQHCLERKAETGFTEAQVFPVCSWSEKTTLSFRKDVSAGSSVTEKGDCRVEAVPIDEVVDPNEPVTFIKMDVEGSELESLKGAKATILRDKPKLAICIYHKPEDIITMRIKS